MDLSKFIDSKAFYTGIALMIVGALGGYAWKKRQFLLSKFKSTRLFLFFPKVKEVSLDFSQRILQNCKPIEHSQKLDDYIRSFDEWGSENSGGITLSIVRGSETRTYYGVTKIYVSNKFPFDNAQDITIIHKKPGRDIASPSTIEFVINEDVGKLAEQCYYQEFLGTKELNVRWGGHWYTNS